MHEHERDLAPREENELLREQLRQARTMETVGRLAGGVVHDFNNVLMAIGGHAERLLFTIDESDPNWKAANAIARATERAAWLTRQLALFTRYQPQPPRRFDLEQLLARQVKLLRRIAGTGVQVTVAETGATWPVVADEGAVERLVLRIAALSPEALPRGGKLALATANEELPGDARVRLEARLEPSITDDAPEGGAAGAGGALAAADAFQSLFEGAPAESHLPLEAGEQPGGVLVVRLYLPCAADRVPGADSLPRQAAARGAGERILLVEDDDDVRDVLARAIQAQGYRALEARNAGEALLLFEREGERLDLLVTDIVMPIVSGVELWDRLSARRPGMRAVFVSGGPAEVNREAVSARGGVLLSKPFHTAALLTAIREALGSTVRANLVVARPANETP